MATPTVVAMATPTQEERYRSYTLDLHSTATIHITPNKDKDAEATIQEDEGEDNKIEEGEAPLSQSIEVPQPLPGGKSDNMTETKRMKTAANVSSACLVL
jgi:hypothetical protein